MATWTELTDAQRGEAINRILNSEKIDDVAISYGLKSESLSRTLRRLRAAGVIEDYIKSVEERDDEPIPQSTFVEDGNEASLEWNSGYGPIVTLDELIASHKIDLAIWKQYGQVTHNTWTTPRAKRGESGFEFFQNHQIKANFIKAEPQPFFPVIQPVTIGVQYAPPPEPKRDGIGTSFIFADPHFGFSKDIKTAQLTPFHDRKALDLCLQLVAAIKPDRVDILGDWLDMAEWTDKFMKDPEFYWTTQPALLESSWWLTQIRATLPEAHISLHQGNHDMRLDDAIKAHLPAAYQLKAVNEIDLPPALSLPKLLALHELQVEWVPDYPYDRSYLNNRLSVEHGERALSPGMTASRIVKDSTETVIFGHIHRREMLTRSIQGREGAYSITGFCPACICHIDGRVPGSSPREQWQNGAAFVEYEIGGDYHNLTPIFMEHSRCVFGGQMFEGRDRTDEIKSSMDGWLI